MSHVLNQNQTIMTKFTKDIPKYHLNCAVSSSVKSETVYKVNQLIQFLDKALIVTIKNTMAKQRKLDKRKDSEPIGIRDFLAVEAAFYHFYLYGAGIADLKAIETFVVCYLENKLSSNPPITPQTAFIEMVAWVLKRISDIRTALDKAILLKQELAKEYTITPNQADVIMLEGFGLDKRDAEHIASAKQAQRGGICSKAIFVTLDYTTIITYQTRIFNEPQLAIWCTDPLYCAYHTF